MKSRSILVVVLLSSMVSFGAAQWFPSSGTATVATIATGAFGFTAYVVVSGTTCNGHDTFAIGGTDAFVQRQLSLLTAAKLSGKPVKIYSDSATNLAYNGWCNLIGVEVP
jgi:hypothetical protein